MRTRIVTSILALVATAAAFGMAAGPASAAGLGKTGGNQCTGYYVNGVQVVGPGIYCPDAG